MRYRKKPVVIQAVQWKDGKIQGGAPDWIQNALNAAEPGLPGSIMRHGEKVLIYTLEGIMEASDGDWIIQGVNGELYPCKPDVFEKTYESADDDFDSDECPNCGDELEENGSCSNCDFDGEY